GGRSVVGGSAGGGDDDTHASAQVGLEPAFGKLLGLQERPAEHQIERHQGRRDVEPGKRQALPDAPVRVSFPCDCRLPASVRAKMREDRKSTRLNSSHGSISYAVVCMKKKTAESEREVHQYDTTRQQ